MTRIPAGQADTAAFLAGLAGGPPVETHISAVFRGDGTVWKLKKAVRLGFLDFSACDDRRRFLERELVLNAPHVPGLYRDVVAVTRDGTGLRLGGDGEAVDWVLRMARVPEADFMDRMAAESRIGPAVLLGLADAVAAMHSGQTPTALADPVAAMLDVAEGNVRAAHSAGLDPAGVEAWGAGIAAAFRAKASLVQPRGALVRRTHGDLHLGNLLMWRGRPAPFDALEFSESLATTDPAYDLAFLLMDLDQRVGRAAANLVLGRYVARTGDAGLVAGLAPFLSMRVMVRAHVEAARGRPHAALLRAALGYLAPVRAGVLAVGGLMGTGKSTLARAVAPGFGPAPGALVLRSDEVRKRLHGVPPEARLPASAYTPAAHDATNDALLDQMHAAIRGGHAIVMDATFLGPALRSRVADMARDAAAPFLGVWLTAPLAELERRVAARTGDASDADGAVLRAAADAPAPADWLHVDATDAAHAQHQVQLRLAVL